MISDDAVDAAAKYLSERFFWNGPLLNEVAREVLEAASPHMPPLSRRQGSRAVGDLIKATKANGWDEGYAAGVREEQPGWTKNPYRSQP